MGKIGDIVPGKKGPVSGWKKSGARTMSEAVPASRSMGTGRSPTHGSHERMSGEHNQGARGKHNTLQHADTALGSHTRTFNKGIPGPAPCNYSGSGSKKSKELGK